MEPTPATPLHPPGHIWIVPYTVSYVIAPGTVTKKSVPILWIIFTAFGSTPPVGRLKNTAPYLPPGTAFRGGFIFTVTCISDFGGTTRFIGHTKLTQEEK